MAAVQTDWCPAELRTAENYLIRHANPSDTRAIVGLALRALMKLDTGGVVVRTDRIEAEIRRLISDPSSLVLVAGDPINGCIALQVNNGTYFERKVAGIVLWYATGAGYALLRRAVSWCNERPAIKVIGISQDFGGDSRAGKLLERAGLKRRGSVFARY